MTIKAVGTRVGDEHERRVRNIGKLVRKRRCAKGKIRRHEAASAAAAEAPSTLQKLFLSCKDIFKGAGTVPSPDDVQKLCSILDDMRPEDVGLNEDLPIFKPGWSFKGTPRVTYTNIYKCDNFSICMFLIPETGVIPLHNHPGMTVFGKLLLGEMHIKSYDWVDPSAPNDAERSSQLRLAKLKVNKVFKAPCDTFVLYPTTGGNMHAFTGMTPCVVLDVLGPPYSAEDDRDCSYYKDFPYAAFADDVKSGDENGRTKEEGECYGWLEEIEVPEDSHMDGIEYLGPEIIDDTI